MTAQNEYLHEKITRLEKDNQSLLRALHHAETKRSASERTLCKLETFIQQQGLSDAKELFLRQESYESAVDSLMQYIATARGVGYDEYDSLCHRSLEEHKERQEDYNTFKGNV